MASDWERSDSGPRKRVYALTEAGVEELDRRATDLAEGERRIDAFLDRYLKARRLPPARRRRAGAQRTSGRASRGGRASRDQLGSP